MYVINKIEYFWGVNKLSIEGENSRIRSTRKRLTKLESYPNKTKKTLKLIDKLNRMLEAQLKFVEEQKNSKIPNIYNKWKH